jgi:hypothetical protein
MRGNIQGQRARIQGEAEDQKDSGGKTVAEITGKPVVRLKLSLFDELAGRRVY